MRGMTPPRFKLRTLFAAVTVFALAFGWVAYQLNWIQQRHALREWIDRYEASGSMQLPEGVLPPSDPADRPPLPWSLRLFGERALEGPIFVDANRDENYTRSEESEFRRCLSRAIAAFPECEIVDNTDRTDYSAEK
jgi:hypothetical protein